MSRRKEREGCRSQQPGSPTVYAELVSTGGGGVPCEVCLSLLLAFVPNEFLATRYLCFFPVSLLSGLFALVFCASEGLCPNEQLYRGDFHRSQHVPPVRPWSPYAGPLQKHK